MPFPIETIRHSTAHLLAEAVVSLWPKTRLGVGPVVEHGFYYDLDVRDGQGNAVRLTPDHLPKVEKRMRELIARKEPFRREEMPLDQAIAFFRERGQDFKVELLRDLKEKGTTAVRPEEAQDIAVDSPTSPRLRGTSRQSTVDSSRVASVYYTGDKFVDLCRGPHVASTADLGTFKLTTIAGAYWRGKETNPQLQRIYGFAFASQAELDAHLTMLAEAERRDHRKLGDELDLFVFSPLVGPGLPLFTPRGNLIREALEEFVCALEQPHGYQRVRIPHITKRDLYETSGHWQKFAQELFHVRTREGHELAMKPMNCPHHTQIYGSRKRSYRELPIRYKEVTSVYRDEQTGELGGLLRVRMITQDDAHVFCRMSQIEAECLKMWDIVDAFYKAFRMPLRVRFSRHDPRQMERYLGTPEIWRRAEEQLQAVIRKRGVTDVIDGLGEAAMYGPKIDFIARDAIGRDWQLATIQLDFNMPERFNLTCTSEEGKDERIVMVHRAILGSLERFMAVLIEHYAGAFPTWLAPVQVALVPVGTKHVAACKKLTKEFAAAGARYELATPDETVGKRIRTYEKLKVPYMLVIGDKEATSSKLAVRVRGKEKLLSVGRKQFLTRLQEEIRKRKS
jgi:threonyl-tRNA synthetase